MDTTPVSLFEAYEQDFHRILAGVKQKLDPEEGSSQSAKQKKAGLRRVELELDEADEMVSQMELELQGIPISIKPSYRARVKSAKADLHRLKKLSKDMHAQASRADLLSRQSSSSSPSPSPSNRRTTTNDRTRLLAGVPSLEDGSRRLRSSERAALETEAHGTEILQGLGAQRDQIQNAGRGLQDADSSVDAAGGRLKKLITRMYRQRVVLAAIAVPLVIVVPAIIIYFKLFR